MNVYFDGNFWGHHGDEEILECIPIKKDFQWEDINGVIFAIYIGRKGVVIDLGTKTSVDEIRAFLERWPEDVREQLSTNEEFERFENDNPVPFDFRVDLTINEERLKKHQGCGVCWYPDIFEEFEADKKAQELMDEYQCDRNYVWNFRRFSYEWEERIEPKELMLTFKSDKVSVSGEHFMTKSGCEEQEIVFTNPITGEKMELTICSCEPRVLDEKKLSDSKMSKGFEFPTHYHELAYTVKPDFKDGEFRLVDCKDGDHARKIKQDIHADGKKAASVAVIGGADGPTSFFFAAKLKGSDEKKYSAFSSMHFEEKEEVEWRPVFQMERRKEMELMIKL